MIERTADDNLLGELVGNCRLEARIGGGGGGAVYQARHQLLGRSQAIKLAPPGREAAQALAREAGMQASLAHPQVLAVIDGGVWRGRGYLALEYMPDGSLRRMLAAGGHPPPLALALGLAAQAAEGLSAIHRAGLLHNDIGPANMLLGRGPDGASQLKIGDFGLARRLGEPADAGRAGTPRYMAPERLNGQGADERSDIYSLGLTLYALLTGRPAFSPRSLHEAAYAQLYQAPAAPRSLRPELDGELEALLLSCIAKAPAARPGSAAALAAALRRAGQGMLA